MPVSQQHLLTTALHETYIKESEHRQGNRHVSGCLSLVFLVRDLHSSAASRGGKVAVLFILNWYVQV